MKLHLNVKVLQFEKCNILTFKWSFMTFKDKNKILFLDIIKKYFFLLNENNMIVQDNCNALRWRHTEHDGASNHQPHHCLLNRLFGCRSKKTSKLCVTGLCVGKSPGTGEFPAQMTSNAENASIWWRHHGNITEGIYPL